MIGVIQILIWLVRIYQFVLLARAILSWIPGIDHYNPVVRFLYDITEPVLRPIRDQLPPTGGLDFSILIAFVICFVLEVVLRSIALSL